VVLLALITPTTIVNVHNTHDVQGYDVDNPNNPHYHYPTQQGYEAPEQEVVKRFQQIVSSYNIIAVTLL
jgi:hypothetical protein